MFFGAVVGHPVEAVAGLVGERVARLDERQGVVEEFFAALAEVVGQPQVGLAGAVGVELPMCGEGFVRLGHKRYLGLV